MKQQISTSLYRIHLSLLVAILIGIFSLNSQAKIYQAADYIKPVNPEEIHPKLSFIIAKRLQYQHYLDINLDDSLSNQIFNSYLKTLDFNRSIFNQEDIDEFEAYRHYLDNAFRRGQLEPAFQIFNRYQQRLAERLTFIVNILENDLEKLNYDSDEELETDRENIAWEKNSDALKALWTRQIKNSILSMKLTDKDDDEIKKVLLKRYTNQLNRLKQTKSEDAFRIFMNALAESFDPHTQYFSPRVSENFDIQMSLSLEGIGAMLQEEDGYTKVKRLITAGPADKAGQLKAGDRIVGVAQGVKGEIVDVIGWRLDDVVQLIRGKKGTTVRLEVIPHSADNEHQTKVLSIVRNTVKLEEQSAQKEVIKVKSNGKEYKIGVIDLPTFYIDFKGAQTNQADYRSTTRDVKRLILELKKEKIDGLVIDLRENGGGSLQEVNTLLGLFIKTGPTVQIKDANSQIASLADENDEVAYDGPLTVLVNRLSASASEIFAGAIQDYHRGIVLGGQTFGKGTVQALQPLSHGQLKLTHAKFYRISGDSTQNRGVIPDIPFPAIYDTEEIGESSLPEALAWDKIPAAEYQQYLPIKELMPNLIKMHEDRIAKDPDFVFLKENLSRIDEIKNKTKVSLNFKIREMEYQQAKQKQLEIENRRRVAKNKVPYASVEEMEKARKDKEESDSAKSEHEKTSDEKEAYLVESAHVLTDFIHLQQEHNANIAAHQK